MIKRIVEISNPARISLKREQLIIEGVDQDRNQVPLEDLALLLIDERSVILTHAILVACAEREVMVVLCDDRHLPCSMILPLEGNTLQAKILRDQIATSEPLKKRLWQSMIRAKLRGQMRVLDHTNQSGHLIGHFIDKVQSGDPNNVEAQAARAYWPALFGKDFRRDWDLVGINALLNYGYAILRAGVARAVVGAGLHPSLGIHHHNQYNTFALADDLIEPFRPIIDREVFEIVDKVEGPPIVDRYSKERLLGALYVPCKVKSRKIPLLSAFHLYTASFREVISGEKKKLEIPEI